MWESNLIQCIIQAFVEAFHVSQDYSSPHFHAQFDAIDIATYLTKDGNFSIFLINNNTRKSLVQE